MSDDQPVIVACGVPDGAPPEVWKALAELGRAAIRVEEHRRAALTEDERQAEDERRRLGRERLERIRRRAREDR